MLILSKITKTLTNFRTAKSVRLVKEWVNFFWKFVFVWVYFQIPQPKLNLRDLHPRVCWSLCNKTKRIHTTKDIRFTNLLHFFSHKYMYNMHFVQNLKNNVYRSVNIFSGIEGLLKWGETQQGAGHVCLNRFFCKNYPKVYTRFLQIYKCKEIQDYLKSCT